MGSPGVSAAAIPSAIRRKWGHPGLGNSAFRSINIGPMDQFCCAINHTPRSKAPFCDAQHTALSGVSVLLQPANRQRLARDDWLFILFNSVFHGPAVCFASSMALALMVFCYERPSDRPRRAQAAARRVWIHSWMDGKHTRGSNRYWIRYFIRWSKQ